MDFTCTVCDRVLQPHASGAESSLGGHSSLRHVKCTACHRYYTPQRFGEHELLYHNYPCELCASRFTSEANLSRHKSRLHRRYTCPLCPRHVSTSSSYNGVADLQAHVDSAHSGHNVYHCRQCSKVFTNSANLSRHVAIVHSRECVYCDDDGDEEDGGGGRRRPKFATDAQLRQHIVTTHNHNVCHFCGDMFRSTEGLYTHQVDHCRHRYKCVSCDREFDTIARLNAHMASYGSDIGACSSHTTPSLARHMQLWNLLTYRHKPWEQDVTHILGTGRIQSEITEHYRRVRGRRGAAVAGPSSRRDDDDDAALRTAAYQHVRDNYIDQLREAYRSNLRQYVNHTTVTDGQISRITVNLLDKRGFFDQVETALRKIFNICRYMVPYNMLLAFGFLLYKMRTKEIEQFFVVDHLQRDPERRAIINQVPNIWLIRTVADEDRVISDIRQTDFFDLLRDRMESEQYNFKILRMTHMTAEIFPAVECNIHNSVVGSQQYVGRGCDSSSDEEDDEDEYDTRDRNPFILTEAEVSDNDDEQDEECDTGGGSKNDEYLIRKYLQSQCRSRKSPVLVSLKKVLMSHNYRSGSQSKYRKLCFFAQVARWKLLCDTGVASDDDIRDKTDEYYELYKNTYNITSDEMFEGVHVSILHFLEYIFKLRINVYEIHSLKQQQPPAQNIAFVDTYYPVIQPLFISTSSPHVYTAKTLHLLLYDNHYYTISDVHKLMNVHYRCISCGTQFTGHKLSNIKRHILDRCGKIRYHYRRGVVDSHENMWEEAKRMFSIPDDIMSDDRRYTSIYATFDFESLLVKESVSDAEYSSQTQVLVIDDDGSECTDQDYMERHRDEQYITVNTPLSYAIACNLRSDDNIEFADRLQHDSDDDVSVAYGVNDNPQQLISDFVATLMTIARVRRQHVINQYEDIICHITQWFAEKYIFIDLTLSSCGGEDAPVATIDHDSIEYYANGNADMVTRYTRYASQQFDVCWREIRLLSKLKKFINHLPVLGFNSGGYDIPLIKPWLFSELVSLTSDDSIEVIKKSSSRYMSVTVYGLPHGAGGFVFLDIMQYLAPGFNLDTFIKSFSSLPSDSKSYFPYEYIDSYDKLQETELPPYESFYSKLKQENVLDAEYQHYIVHKLGLPRGTTCLTDPEHIARAPMNGREKYRQLQQMWIDNNWSCIGDYLEYYNTKDVVPFLRAVIQYAKGLQDVNNVDVVRDAISLPGLAKQILRQHIPHRSLYYIDDQSIYSTIKDNEVGGQSIIFTRKNDEDHPHVKGFDANSLYLYCLGEGQFTGKPIVYESVIDDTDVLIRRRLYRRFPGSKHLTSKDSASAEEYLDYLDNEYLIPQGINMSRQYRIRLTLSEQQYLLTRYDQAGVPRCRLFSAFYVDGYYVTECARDNEVASSHVSQLDTKERHVVEFDGCYWHACQDCGAAPEGFPHRNGVWMSAEKQRVINDCRYTILEQRGYIIHVMKECEWTKLKREDSRVRAYIQQNSSDLRVDPLVIDPDRPYITSTELLLNMLCSKRVFGIVVCDVRVPTFEEDGGYLRKYFEDFAPIIKHAHINYEDIGLYMQELADKSNITVNDRRAVIDSYYGTHIALIDEYVVWLRNKGCIISRIYKFIRYSKSPIFKDFVGDITRMRIKGDKDRNSEMPALMAKLIGNSAFGSTITNKDKHRHVTLRSHTGASASASLAGNGDYRALVSSLLTFVRYEELTPHLLEVECRYDKIVYDQLRYIAKTIFDRAKLSVLQFYYDFLKRVLKQDSYQLLETDTDSIYIALAHKDFDDNVDPDQWDLYQSLKSQYFLTPDCEYGKRQPNRYKLECEGTMMVSLCSKSYCVYDSASSTVKYSAKGIQKSNFTHHTTTTGVDGYAEAVTSMYDGALQNSSIAQSGKATNRGLKRRYDRMIVYEQDKVMFNSFYCKRLVLSDGIHTRPLDL